MGAHTCKAVAETRRPIVPHFRCFPKGAEGQDQEGEPPEGAGIPCGPPERDPLCPLPAALPAPRRPQEAMPGLPPLRLPRLQPRPPGGGLALPPLPPGQVSRGWSSRGPAGLGAWLVPSVGQADGGAGPWVAVGESSVWPRPSRRPELRPLQSRGKRPPGVVLPARADPLQAVRERQGGPVPERAAAGCR